MTSAHQNNIYPLKGSLQTFLVKNPDPNNLFICKTTLID